ncbi:MAG: trans-sulfuration enzyme family protein [Nitriliruptorales bacterium]
MEPPLRTATGGFTTRAVHAGAPPEVDQHPVSPPIHPSATWGVDRSADLAALLTDEVDGYVYGRYDNPTNTALHAQVASLHGTESAWSFASGTAAILATLETVRRGGRILAASQLYGGTHALLRRQARLAGWEVDRADLGDAGAVSAALTDEHTVVYGETIGNPSLGVLAPDVADICRERGLTFVIDNTFASPWLFRPAEAFAHGDLDLLVVESATKFLGGHGDVVAGVLAGPRSRVAEIRETTYELGGSLGPFEAWLVARGIQTLELRMSRASASAMAVAERLAADTRVASVTYPGLRRHPHHERAGELFGGRGYGAMLAFDLGGRQAAEAFADACSVFTRAASLGATRSLVIHPASTTHRQLGEADLGTAGVGPGLVRVSVGIEDTADLLADVDAALTAI